MNKVLTLTLNGRQRQDAVADNVLLLDYLRECPMRKKTTCHINSL